MSDARAEILARIRAADAVREVDVPAAPAAVSRTDAEVLELFAENVADYRAVVERVAESAMPQAIAGALRAYSASSVVVPDGVPREWFADTDVTVRADDSLGHADLDATSAVVTAAALGIAETGTIVLDHTDGQGRRALSLVPDVHVCVVRADQVVGDVATATSRLRPAVEARRPLTWISGPSATSDIELDRVEGVHGPRTLHVLIIE